ncbi:hypothetical protein HYC85_006981 [Camellia sinensis]|uniref:Uncharacterized protein n=1 Tax=Camellia sinensis TaxID=4442 RepID=A0A7J7HNI8_CAMSI|nr:hypothetical protein HYC85_006981 [Camellia sinensis]
MVNLMYTKVASALVPKGREATEVDQVNLFDDHEQNSEFHVHQGGLSSGVEGREATEVDQVDLFNDHEQNSESHVHQGGLSSGAEGREATEVDQVDLFDDHGLTVSSLVSIDCNEDRGNGPASLDKSFGEDKYVAKEKVVGGMMDKRINIFGVFNGQCSRLVVELGCGESLMPLHSATASSLLNSVLSSKVGQWGCLSEGTN